MAPNDPSHLVFTTFWNPRPLRSVSWPCDSLLCPANTTWQRRGLSLLWLGYETSWLPSVSSFSLMASWLHTLLKQAACWRGPCNKEPAGGFGQEPARDWPSHSSSPGGSESYQQPCKLESGSFPGSVFRCVAGPGGQLYHSHRYLHSHGPVQSHDEIPPVAHFIFKVYKCVLSNVWKCDLNIFCLMV